MSARPVPMNSLLKKTGPALLRSSLLFLSVAFPLCRAKGQEALYNAISLDASIASQSSVMALQPERPHLGPVQLALGSYFGITYEDNAYNSQYNIQSDEILQTGINLGLDWPATVRSDLQLGTGIGYLHYVKNTSNGGLEITPDSALTYALTLDDVIFTF